MRYSVARSRSKAPMATVDPKAPARAPAPAPKPAPVAEVETEEFAPVAEVETEEPAPEVERVNIAGLVLEKTVYPDGMCETEVLQEPMIAPELVRSTRASQRARGH
jgi:hypothetical protein